MAEITVQKPVVGDKPAGNHEPKKAVKAIQKNTNEKKKEPKKKLKIKDIPIIALLVALAGLFLAPIFLVLMNSFKGKLYIGTEPFAFPNENSFVGFDNYLEGADKIGFLPAFFTSLFITVFAVALLVLCTSMCAWFIVRVKKWYSQLLYLLCAFSMIVPFQMVMYPMTQVASKLHLNNIIGIIFVYLGFGAGLAVFMFVGFIKSVPLEIEEAAMIDGCGPVRTYFLVVFPILKPTAITVAILDAMWIWNDYLLPYLLLGSTETKTLPMAIQYLRGGYGSIDMGNMMAMIILSIIPIIIFYLCCQKYIIKGIVAGAVKG
ncbi:MAG: carbohydrate ABC transporter permease [Acutalibacteraceae bacterium]|nr:carbohydrate ABC transporter permease [Acutalibacteraceae bacterium]